MRGPSNSSAAEHHRRLSQRQAKLAAPPSAEPCPSTGTRISSGTTARSWNSNTPMIERPCAESSSRRSASSRDTTAVEDIASAPRRGRLATCHSAGAMPPASNAAPTQRAMRHAHLGRGAQSEHLAAHGAQLGQAEFQTDGEHQEHHAELREMPRLCAVSRIRAQRMRADHHADREIAEHRRQREDAKGHHHRHGASERKQSSGSEAAWRKRCPSKGAAANS